MNRPLQFAVAGLVAGATVATWGLVVRDGSSSVDSDLAPVEALATVQPMSTMISPAAAVEFWEARVEASPNGALDRTQLGNALLTQARAEGDLELYSEAEEVLRGAVDLLPGSESARLGLARALHAQHGFGEAAEIADEVVEEFPDSSAARAVLGDARFELGDLPGARAEYEAVALVERSAPILGRLSRLAAASGENERAVRLAEEALAADDLLDRRAADRAFPWFQLGHARFGAGDVDGAIADLERALDIDPGNAGASEKLAYVYASVGRLDDAARLYEQLIETGPAADLHGSYADVLRALGDDAAAEEQERLGRQLADETRDGFPAERRHLIGFETTREPALAVELAELDLAERQDSGAYDALAWALFHDDRAEEAAELIAPMLASGVRDASMLFHAGAISAEIGDVDAARTYLTNSLTINDRFHPTEADDARALLDSLDAPGSPDSSVSAD